MVFVHPSFAADKYVIDPQHVSVSFSMQHSKWAKYQGTIRTIAGIILFDREDVTRSSVQVEMASASVDTLDAARNSSCKDTVFWQRKESEDYLREHLGRKDRRQDGQDHR